MKRTDLVAYRKTLVTPDVAESIRQLELRAAALGGVRLNVHGALPNQVSWYAVKSSPGPTACPPVASMIPAGREVLLRLHLIDYQGDEHSKRQREVELLWGLAVPCGFTPWLRYPLSGIGDDVFHFMGPWQPLYDSLLGEGRGEIAWPSVCAAAQVDAGRWEGGKVLERFVQAQLHRVGVPCGPIDGEIGDRTLMALRALGLPREGQRMDDVAKYLMALEPPTPSKTTERKHGFISVPDTRAMAVCSGKVALMRTPQGYTLTIDGPGRVILDVGDQP